ncbi:MAG: metal-dependent transcriptional regulator [Sulfolobaceae archaeon]
MRISSRELRYLKVIKQICETEGTARLTRIAKELSLNPSSVFDEINHLVEKGFVKRESRGVKLTEEGERLLNEIKRNHRIIECFFERIGIPLSQICEYAEQIDYILPSDVIDKIYVYIGRPAKCPHGKDI